MEQSDDCHNLLKGGPIATHLLKPDHIEGKVSDTGVTEIFNYCDITGEQVMAEVASSHHQKRHLTGVNSTCQPM